jgi:hypothetical protein
VNAFTATRVTLWHHRFAPRRKVGEGKDKEALGLQLRKSDGLVTAELRSWSPVRQQKTTGVRTADDKFFESN